jgi:hypothetical protein
MGMIKTAKTIKFDINPKNFKKGTALIYTIFVISILLAISFGVSDILMSQAKMLDEVGHSVVAFYAADAGIEKFLIDRGDPDLTPNYYNGSLSSDISFTVVVYQGGSASDCPSEFYYCAKSTGIFKNTRRAILVKY